MPKTPLRLFKGATETSHLDLVGEFDQYESVSFGIAWYGVGQFSLTVNKNIVFNTTSTLGAELIPGRYIMLGNSSRNFGVITGIQDSFDSSGKASERITVTGEEAKGLLRRRMVNNASVANWTLTDQAETVMKELVKDQCGADASAARQFADFTIAADGSAGANYTINARWTNLLDELDACSRATGIGYWIEFNSTTKKLVFTTGSGVDRSAAQSTNPRAIFSNTWNSIGSGQYQYSELEHRNLAYVGGSGVGLSRVIRTVYDTSEPTGIDRREAFIDARDLTATADLDARGAQELEAVRYTEYIDVTALTSSPVEYGTAYNVGDLCTISAFAGEYNTRIIGATIVIEPNRYEIELQFDKRAPSLPSIVAKSKAAESYNAGNIETQPTSDNTWTPTLIGSTTAGTQTYTEQTGYYYKIGKMVFFRFQVQISAKDAAMAGNATIGGLPFTSATVSGTATLGGAFVTRTLGITLQAGRSQLLLRVTSNGTIMRLEETGTGVNSAGNGVLVTNLAASTVIAGAGWYEAAS